MPGYDATGPEGRGPMSGWRRGFCKLRKGAEELPESPWARFLESMGWPGWWRRGSGQRAFGRRGRRGGAS